MHVKKELLNRNSCLDYRDELIKFCDSGAAIIHVRTRETIRCAMETRKIVSTQTAEDEGGQVIEPQHYEWNIIDGLVNIRPDNMEFINVKKDSDKGDMDIGDALKQIVNQSFATVHNRNQRIYYTIIDPHYHLERNPYLMHFMQVMSVAVPASQVRVIFITPDEPLPSDLDRYCSTLYFRTPGHAELVDFVRASVALVEQSAGESVFDLDEEGVDVSDIALSGLGMTRESFELYLSIAAVERFDTLREGEYITAEDMIRGISKGKTEVVKQSDLLELYPVEDIHNVGGMDVLKAWIRKRRDCYSDKAAEFGIEPPKGIVAVGVPGTGKSLMAKAVAGELNIPLVRLDFGRVFNSLVGSSEERMRSALSLVEAMAPCVLFIDEVDKGLAGMGGGGDAGTSSRVMGTFLTWLNDNKSPVFTVVTANNVTHLPPELLRKGRFDQIFTFGMPMHKELREVLDIHLAKRGWSMEQIYKGKEAQLNYLLENLLGYVPAEVEAVVKDALVDAFSDDADLDHEYLLKAAENIVPMLRSHLSNMLITLAWVESNGVLASSEAISSDNIDKETGSVNVIDMTAHRQKQIRGLTRKPK